MLLCFSVLRDFFCSEGGGGSELSAPGLNEIFSIKTGLEPVEDGTLFPLCSAAGAEAFFIVPQLVAIVTISAENNSSLTGIVFNRNIGGCKIANTLPKSKSDVRMCRCAHVRIHKVS